MRHRHYRPWRPHRKHYRDHRHYWKRDRGGYREMALNALQVIGMLGTVLVALVFKRKP